MQKCVEHYRDGRDAWNRGVLGFFTRLRGIISIGIFNIVTMGIPFWWPSSMPNRITIPILYICLIVTIILGSIAYFSFIYLRWRSYRSLNIKYWLHRLSHMVRDEQSKLYSKTTHTTRHNKKEESENFYEYMDRICNEVKGYFGPQLNDETIEVAIRLAVDAKPKAPIKVVYTTIGRSNGLSPKRYETTEDLPSNEGIPLFLKSKGNGGALIYNDLQKAAELGAYKPMLNDEKYKDEIVTMMVGPINGWCGNEMNMLGLLYITSRKHNIFKHKHIDAMGFVCDSLATSIAFTVEQLKTCGRMNHIRRRT